MKITSEYIGFFDLDNFTEIKAKKEKGHIHIRFIDSENKIEYSVNLYQKHEKSRDFNGKFVSHSIATKEKVNSGSADCKMIKDEDKIYLIGFWSEEAVQYGWVLNLSKISEKIDKKNVG